MITDRHTIGEFLGCRALDGSREQRRARAREAGGQPINYAISAPH
jgi:hypothetical protein